MIEVAPTHSPTKHCPEVFEHPHCFDRGAPLNNPVNHPRGIATMDLSKRHIPDHWNHILAQPTPNFCGCTEWCRMFLDVAIDQGSDGHCAALMPGIVTLID
jgi:hypothetical protein